MLSPMDVSGGGVNGTELLLASPSTHHQPQPSPHQSPQQQNVLASGMHSPVVKESTMRHRQVAKEPEPEPDNLRRFVRSLKTLDVYPKTEEELSIQTQGGGFVSLTSFIIITLLLFSEIWAFLVPQTTHSIIVDTRPSSKLQINFDITFHALRCSETSIDVMDVSGEAQVAIETNLHRVRLTADGKRIGGGEYEDHAHDSDGTPGRPNPGLNPMLAALGLQGFGGMPNMGPDAHVDQKGEGCNVVGTLSVNKVAGNVHIALGGMHSHGKSAHQAPEGTGAAPHQSGHDHGHEQHQQHIHQFMIHEMAQYNCSHTIKQLSFGQLFPGVVNPLDGTSQIIPQGQGSAHMQYFIKIIPTVYESTFMAPVDTNQFSVTQHSQPITMQDAFNGGAGGKIPGVFFVYDLSPFMVRVSEKRIPFSTFITSVFAIVGGVFTIAGIIDSIYYHSSKIVLTSPKK